MLLILTWQTPTAGQWLMLLVIGVFATLGQLALVAAYRHAAAARLVPLDFVRLVVIAAAVLIFFKEQLQPSLVTGMLILVATTIYTVQAKTQLIEPVEATLPQTTVIVDADTSKIII